MRISKQFTYPVNERHSEVLGYSPLSKYGAHLWRQLRWSGAWEEASGNRHLFNPNGGQYLHVPVEPLGDHASYRVRCIHVIGSKWRGGIVTNVQVEKVRRRWQWIVTVSRKKGANE